jgi:AbrB family looped-hinge helix DNA binding protein
LKFLGNSKLTVKFQVTVPKAVRKMLGLGTGDLLVFVMEEEQVVVKRGEVRIAP